MLHLDAIECHSRRKQANETLTVEMELFTETDSEPLATSVEETKDIQIVWNSPERLSSLDEDWTQR